MTVLSQKLKKKAFPITSTVCPGQLFPLVAAQPSADITIKVLISKGFHWGWLVTTDISLLLLSIRSYNSRQGCSISRVPCKAGSD